MHHALGSRPNFSLFELCALATAEPAMEKWFCCAREGRTGKAAWQNVRRQLTLLSSSFLHNEVIAPTLQDESLKMANMGMPGEPSVGERPSMIRW